MRPGYNFTFPTVEYVKVLRCLSKKKMMTYEDIRVAVKGKLNRFGVKLKRMLDQDLIQKETRGVYSITPLGMKTIKAYDAFIKIMEGK